MNITKLPIFNTNEHKLCHITHSDDDCEWTVHTGDGPTITTLVLSPRCFYAQLEVPREDVETHKHGMDYQIIAVDADGESGPDSDEQEHMKFTNRRIRNASGKPICELSFSDEDDTWGITFYGKEYNTTLFLYFTGAYSQVEIPTEELE